MKSGRIFEVLVPTKSRKESKSMKLHTYLNFGGNCAQAFRFYEQHLGGKIIMMMNHGQQPKANAVSPEWKNAILHARINIGDTVLMGADIAQGQVRHVLDDPPRTSHAVGCLSKCWMKDEIDFRNIRAGLYLTWEGSMIMIVAIAVAILIVALVGFAATKPDTFRVQ